MKKVVINDCFGGFSISPKAIKRMAELQGRECYFFTNPKINGDYVPCSIDADDWQACDCHPKDEIYFVDTEKMEVKGVIENIGEVKDEEWRARNERRNQD